MPRRVQPRQQSLFAPANDLLRKISDADIRQRKRIMVWVTSICAAAFLWSFLAGDQSIFAIWKLSNEQQALRKANRELIAELIDAERTRNLLLSDPTYIELVARTQYHMVFPGETVYRIKAR